MQHTDKAIAEFEAWWDRQPHREQYEDVKDQMRNVWVASWAESRAQIVIELPDDGIDDCREAWPGRCRDTFDCGYNFASWRHEQAIEAAGIPLRNE